MKADIVFSDGFTHGQHVHSEKEGAETGTWWDPKRDKWPPRLIIWTCLAIWVNVASVPWFDPKPDWNFSKISLI